ncbi:MAG: mechanosensitive ion channel [Parachlamydiales bacterium]|nr:mechanosensitive ion channel [Parachlamydiales bacterium]
MKVKFLFLGILCFFSMGAQDYIASKPDPSFPDPLNLRANWWEYFDATGEELQQKTSNFIEYLQKIEQKIPPEYSEQTGLLIDKIRNHLHAYSMQELAIVLPLNPKSYLQEYDLSAFVDLAERLWANTQNMQVDQMRIRLMKESIRKEEKSLDTLLSSYLGEEPSYEKMIKGLRIISTKISLVIDQDRMIVMEEQWKRQEKENAFTEEEVMFARQHLLLPSIAAISSWDAEINDVKSSLKKSQENVIQAQKENALFREKGYEAADVTRSMQKLLQASVQEAQYRTLLIHKEVLKAFVQLGNSKKVSVIVLNAQIEKWLEEMKNIQKDLKGAQEFSQLTFQGIFQSSSALDAHEFVKEDLLELTEKTLLDIQTEEKNLFVAEFLIDQYSLLVQEKYSTFFSKIQNFAYQFILFFKVHVTWFSESLFKIGDTPITPLALLRFLIFITMTYFIAAFLRRMLRRLGEKKRRLSSAALYTISRLVFYCVLLIGIMISLSILGIDFTALAVIFGALSVGIGFGLQAIVSNFLAGIIVLLEKKIRVGDFIELESGEKGMVKGIDVRSTLIKTSDNLEIIIPNSELVTKKFTNWTLTEKIRRVRIPFSVAYGSSKEQVRQVVIEAAKTISITLTEKEPDVWLIALGESSLDFELVVWVNEYLAISDRVVGTISRYLWVIESALVKNNISIPYPVREVHITKQ